MSEAGTWRYVESIHKDGWYVDNGREFGPVFICSSQEAAIRGDGNAARRFCGPPNRHQSH